jgi:hypothetical protein
MAVTPKSLHQSLADRARPKVSLNALVVVLLAVGLGHREAKIAFDAGG